MTPIEKCPEGHEADVECLNLSAPYIYFTQCLRNDCWCGPSADTPEEAIEKWNRVMRIYHGHEALRDVVRSAIPKEGDRP